MDYKMNKIVHKSKLVLDGQYIDGLNRKINKTERYLEDFYKRAKMKVEETRAELRKSETKMMTPDDVRRELDTLHSELDASNSEDEREDIIEKMRSELFRVQNLPHLIKDSEFEKFLKKDFCPFEVVYTQDESIEYESDFESDSDTDGECQTNIGSDGQVGGRIKISSELDDEVCGARPKLENDAKKLKSGPVILSSEPERQDNDTYGRTYCEVNKEHGKLTSKRQKEPKAASLRDLTIHPQYTLNEKEENVFSFSELKHHLVEVEIPEEQPKSNPEFKILDEGDIELPACTDVKLFDTYIIIATTEHLIKMDKVTNNTLDKLKLPFAGHMCSIRKSSCIGVIQTNSFITVVSTDPKLKILYKIKTTKAYTNICHVGTFVNTPREEPDPSFTFGLVYTVLSIAKGKPYVEKIDMVKAAATAAYQKVPQYDARVHAFDVTPFDVSGISGIGAVWSQGKLKLILGCAENIICLEKSQSKIRSHWNITINKAATDVVCLKSMAYICVQDEERVMLVGVDGKVESENVLDGILKCRPHRLSVCGDSILVKSFEETRWKSLVFAKQNKN